MAQAQILNQDAVNKKVVKAMKKGGEATFALLEEFITKRGDEFGAGMLQYQVLVACVYPLLCRYDEVLPGIVEDIIYTHKMNVRKYGNKAYALTERQMEVIRPHLIKAIDNYAQDKASEQAPRLAETPVIVKVQEMSAKEAAAHFGKSVRTIQRWAQQGKIAARKIGRKWIVEA